MAFKCAFLSWIFFFIRTRQTSYKGTASVVDREFEDQTKDYKIVICCFSAKHTSLSNKSKDWLVQNQSNVSEWNSMSSLELFISELAL